MSNNLSVFEVKNVCAFKIRSNDDMGMEKRLEIKVVKWGRKPHLVVDSPGNGGEIGDAVLFLPWNAGADEFNAIMEQVEAELARRGMMIAGK